MVEVAADKEVIAPNWFMHIWFARTLVCMGIGMNNIRAHEQSSSRASKKYDDELVFMKFI